MRQRLSYTTMHFEFISNNFKIFKLIIEEKLYVFNKFHN